jgi:hypothetical protein
MPFGSPVLKRYHSYENKYRKIKVEDQYQFAKSSFGKKELRE